MIPRRNLHSEKDVGFYLFFFAGAGAVEDLLDVFFRTCFFRSELLGSRCLGEVKKRIDLAIMPRSPRIAG